MEGIALDFASIGTVMPAQLPQPDQPVMKGLRKQMWLLLYTEGGMWTAAEIKAHLGLMVRWTRNANPVHSILGEMVRDGFLQRRRMENIDGETIVKYGVSGNCNIPRGVTPDEISELIRLAAGKRA